MKRYLKTLLVSLLLQAGLYGGSILFFKTITFQNYNYIIYLFVVVMLNCAILIEEIYHSKSKAILLQQDIAIHGESIIGSENEENHHLNTNRPVYYSKIFALLTVIIMNTTVYFMFLS